MKSKKSSVFGLYYMHSFKKIVLVWFLYILSCPILEYIYLSNSAVLLTEDYIKPQFFVYTTFGVFFLAMLFFHRSTTIVSSDKGIISRLNVSKKQVASLSYLYFLIIFILTILTMIIGYFLLIQVYLHYFPNAFYNKPYIFAFIVSDHFIHSFLPFYEFGTFVFKMVSLLIIELVYVYIQSNNDMHFFADLFIALCMAFVFSTF